MSGHKLKKDDDRYLEGRIILISRHTAYDETVEGGSLEKEKHNCHGQRSCVRVYQSTVEVSKSKLVGNAGRSRNLGVLATSETWQMG